MKGLSFIRLCSMGLALCLCAQGVTQAATRTWTGGGLNNFWTNSANWGGTTPVSGDDLVFPAGAARLSNSNNLGAGNLFNSITFSGSNYVINGNLLILTAGITNNGPAGTTNTFNLAHTADNDPTIYSVATNTTLFLGGDINTVGDTLMLEVDGAATFSGVIWGPGT